LGYEQALPEGAVVEALEFRNTTDSYPIHFRSAVFRESKPTVRVEPADSPLELTGLRNEVKLKDEWLDQVRDVSFAIYRSGGLVGATVGGAAPNLPRGLERQLSAEQVLQRVSEGNGERRSEAYFPLLGEGWSGAVLAAFLPDRDYGAYERWVNRIGVL